MAFLTERREALVSRPGFGSSTPPVVLPVASAASGRSQFGAGSGPIQQPRGTPSVSGWSAGLRADYSGGTLDEPNPQVPSAANVLLAMQHDNFYPIAGRSSPMELCSDEDRPREHWQEDIGNRAPLPSVTTSALNADASTAVEAVQSDDRLRPLQGNVPFGSSVPVTIGNVFRKMIRGPQLGPHLSTAPTVVPPQAASSGTATAANAFPLAEDLFDRMGYAGPGGFCALKDIAGAVNTPRLPEAAASYTNNPAVVEQGHSAQEVDDARVGSPIGRPPSSLSYISIEENQANDMVDDQVDRPEVGENDSEGFPVVLRRMEIMRVSLIALVSLTLVRRATIVLRTRMLISCRFRSLFMLLLLSSPCCVSPLS